MNIILASGSPRRRELLQTALLDFTIMQVDIDETPHPDETPTAYIERMVAEKALAAIQKIQRQSHEPAAHFSQSIIILTADTIGVLPDGHTVLIKPIDREHAYQMWQQMSDDTHEVWTAVQATQVVLSPELMASTTASNQAPTHTLDGNKHTITVVEQKRIIERTDVTFIPLNKDTMQRYWNSGEPTDKAGGYAIQGLAAAWVSHINGSYTNVVGLPLAQTLALIESVKNSAND